KCSCGTDHATAVREFRIRRHFSRVWIAFETAGSRAHYKKQIRVAILSIGKEARPVPVAILRHQQVVGLALSGRPSEDAIDVDSASPRRPGSKSRSTCRNEVGSHGSIPRYVGLRDHEKPSLLRSNQLLGTRNDIPRH